jgi:hypothetical protein
LFDGLKLKLIFWQHAFHGEVGVKKKVLLPAPFPRPNYQSRTNLLGGTMSFERERWAPGA